MRHDALIRDEVLEDIDAITDVTVEAFKTLDISSKTEQFIVLALRAAGALTISLVAEQGGRVVGHIAFSPVSISDGSPGWYGLGPVSVLPELHGKGIGSALVSGGLERLNSMGAKGCCLVGYPDYYRRFGFGNISGLGVEDVPDYAVLCLSFIDHQPQGTVTFHQAFTATG